MIKGDWVAYVACALICFVASLGFEEALGAAAEIPWNQTKVGHTAPTLAALLLNDFVESFLLICMVGIGVRHALGTRPKIPDHFLPFKQLKRTAMAIVVYMIPQAALALVFHVGVHGPIYLLVVEIGKVHTPLYWIGNLVMALLNGPVLMGFCAAMFSTWPILEAFGEGFRRTGWQGILLSLSLLVAIIAAASGFIAFGVGALFTGPILTNVIALHYLYYFPPEPEHIPAQSVNSALSNVLFAIYGIDAPAPRFPVQLPADSASLRLHPAARSLFRFDRHRL
jgi:hypothetical protein